MTGDRAAPAHREWSVWLIPALLVIAGGAATGVIRSYAGSGHEPESRLADIAFAAPTTVAGLLAFAGVLGGRRGLVVGAGIALYPISVVSFVMWPLVIPASFLVAHGFTLKGTSNAADLAETALVALGLPVAFFSLLLHEDPVTWQTATESGGASDVVTTLEAAISLSITAAVAGASVLVMWLAGDRGSLSARRG